MAVRELLQGKKEEIKSENNIGVQVNKLNLSMGPLFTKLEGLVVNFKQENNQI